ncbi:MAG: GatB/YqeY domain-containing protein [Acetobacteraceae bacterium]
MPLREQFATELKTALKAGHGLRVSTLRLVLARLKEVEIAARPGGQAVGETEIQSMLRGMVKSRRESAALYRQGNRPELAAREEGEIAVIEGFLPASLGEAALAEAIAAAVAETGASGSKDMGKVMAALKARHGAAIDLAAAGPLVRTRLAS